VYCWLFVGSTRLKVGGERSYSKSELQIGEALDAANLVRAVESRSRENADAERSRAHPSFRQSEADLRPIAPGPIAL